MRKHKLADFSWLKALFSTKSKNHKGKVKAGIGRIGHLLVQGRVLLQLVAELEVSKGTKRDQTIPANVW